MGPLRFFFRHFNHSVLCLSNQTPDNVGGQAVIEGVMMRSATNLAVAVRCPKGEIVVDNRHFVPFSRRVKAFSVPVLRGATALVESLFIGMRALTFSAEVVEGRREGKPGFSARFTAREKLAIGVTMLASFAFSMLLFQLVPYGAAMLMTGSSREHAANPLLYNLSAGVVRVTLLLTYVWLISNLNDIKRVFQYHGAEHMSIFAHEKGLELSVENARAQTRFHPRCGTSFLLIVAMVCVMFFSTLDAILLSFYANPFPTAFHRFFIHLPFVPLVAGLSFEVLKMSARFQGSKFFKPLVWPGLMLQRLTTRDPDDSQLEVAIRSLQVALVREPARAAQREPRKDEALVTAVAVG